MNYVMMFVVSFDLIILFYFILISFFLAGACCGINELNGCVNDNFARECSSTGAEWIANEVCADSCGKSL